MVELSAVLVKCHLLLNEIINGLWRFGTEEMDTKKYILRNRENMVELQFFCDYQMKEQALQL